jgi:twitching motility protein PilJ
VSLPILGTATTAKHQRTLFTLLGGSVLVLVVLSAWMLREAGNSNQQLAATGQALMQSQRLAKSVSIAMTGPLLRLPTSRTAPVFWRATCERWLPAIPIWA